MNLQKLNRSLHRELGFFFAALTILYAISGVALNHIKDWNPNYKIEIETKVVALGKGSTSVEDILEKVGEASPVKNTYRPAPGLLQIFTERSNITVDLVTGNVEREKFVERPVIFPMNYLHLNHAKKGWTFVADLYAVALALIAVTGLFLTKGKRGLRGRGGVLALMGVAVPVFFFYLYH